MIKLILEKETHRILAACVEVYKELKTRATQSFPCRCIPSIPWLWLPLK